jgi:hypothetical protein
MFRQRLTCAIENRSRRTTSLFVERILVRNPRATGILESQHLRLARHTLDIVAALFIRKVPANRFYPTRVKLLSELLGRDPVSSGELNVSDAKSTHLVQRLAHIFLELIAETVKLKTDSFWWNSFDTRRPRQRHAPERHAEKYECRFHTRDPVFKIRLILVSFIL